MVEGITTKPFPKIAKEHYLEGGKKIAGNLYSDLHFT